ncbi:ABC transporter [Cutibacterium acnes JCM 18918]|nr:ABC transporter [Cutibacterium acnes JCM 18918]
MLANEVTRYRAVLDSSGVDTEVPSRIRARSRRSDRLKMRQSLSATR